ncbi:MAG: hypothetical protein JNK74_21180 [Candidatus Hydrogenedentes bacterium]|nr:hypothetical protein [Candidatus Hydrogenedentota bacterium]
MPADQVETSPRMSRVAPFAPLAIAGFFLAVALFHGLRTTRDLQWHPGNDAYRDIALAQIILDGDYPADYLYADEWLWYNPLTGALIAAGAWAADVPPPLANVRMAPWLNLIVPIAFFVLVWYLTDAWIALLALVSFLFLLPQDRPSFVSAGYSPWLLAPHLSQALFYATLLAWVVHLRSASLRSALAAGCLLGLTFLGHTAPAVLLGAIMVITATLSTLREARAGQRSSALARSTRLGVALVVAFVVSLPFTISILYRYHLHVVNPRPTEWVWEGAALENLPSILTDLISFKSAFMVVGLIAIFFRALPRFVKEVVPTWLAVASAFLLYSLLAQWAARHGMTLPQINPGYHYVLYLIAIGHLLFALGLVWIVERILTGSLSGERKKMMSLVRVLGVVALAAVLFATNYRDFRVWHGFTRDHGVALRRLDQLDSFAPYYWIVENTKPGAVFLSNDRPGLYCVAAAGRRVVANDPYFSSLYVPYAPRAEARELLWTALREKDEKTFKEAAKAWRVAYVLAEGEQRDWAAQSEFSDLEEVFASTQFTIYRLPVWAH